MPLADAPVPQRRKLITPVGGNLRYSCRVQLVVDLCLGWTRRQQMGRFVQTIAATFAAALLGAFAPTSASAQHADIFANVRCSYTHDASAKFARGTLEVTWALPKGDTYTIWTPWYSNQPVPAQADNYSVERQAGKNAQKTIEFELIASSGPRARWRISTVGPYANQCRQLWRK